MNLGAVAAAVLVVGLLGGCSGDEAPATLPTVSPTVAPSPSAQMTAAVITVPSLAQEATPQGASAFAGHYLALLNEAFATGDGTQVDAVSDTGCEGCNNLLSLIDRQSSDRRIVGADYELLAAATSEVADGDALVDFTYALAEGGIVDGTGTAIETVPAEGPTKAQMRLQHASNQWTVLGFRLAT